MNRPRRAGRKQLFNRPRKGNKTGGDYHGLNLSANRDALLQSFIDSKPTDGEDFFCFSLITNSAEPTWDHRRQFVGAYETCAALCTAFVFRMLQNGGPRKGRFEIYQGQNARDYLAYGVAQERRYRLERQGQPNN